jgi:RNA polymerase sigma factor (TIGR02999 family)
LPDTGINRLIHSAEEGNDAAGKALFSVMYSELHRIAQRELRRNGSLTLSPTTLLHEAYLSMSAGASPEFPDRPRFLAYACRAMRGLVIDYVRSRSAKKRGGEFEFTALSTVLPEGVNEDRELERLGEAVDALAVLDPRLARLVDLKFFCGFSFEEVAGLLKVSVRTAKRDWNKARIFLQRELRSSDTGLEAFD